MDAVLICLAYTLSFAVRFDGDIPDEHFRVLAQSLPVILSLKLLVFASFGLYGGVWRYVSVWDLLEILKAVTLSSILAIAAMTMVFRFELFPRTVFVVDWMALLLMVAGIRLLIRIIREYLFSLSDTKGKKVVIVGAGDAGEMVLRKLRHNVQLKYVPVGFFDDDPGKQGRRIHGVPVLGGRDKIMETAPRLGIDQIMVAMPSAGAESLDVIIRICKSTGVPVTVVPSFTNMIQKGQWERSFEEQARYPQPRMSEVPKEHT